MKPNKVIFYVDKVANAFEIVIGIFLLAMVAVKFAEVVMGTAGHEYTVIDYDFKEILSMSFNLVIGVEFIKMLYKHTPESVIDVLLFAVSRQTVIYYEGTYDLLIGVAAIAGLFAAKRFLIEWQKKKD
jgi:hypothetical protein